MNVSSIETSFVTYKKKDYCVFLLKHRKKKVPILINKSFYHLLNEYDNWKCDKTHKISCSKIIDGVEKKIYLHNLLLKNNSNKKISHINKINNDNRIENLTYVTKNNININKNKRKRTIKIFKNNLTQRIPTYVWYQKSDGSHGDRFVVKLGNKIFKTTSSKKISLKCKLEEAKHIVNVLRKKYPKYFSKCSVNGELNEIGKKLYLSYCKILEIFNPFHSYDEQKKLQNVTTKLLKHVKLKSYHEEHRLNDKFRDYKKRYKQVPKCISCLPDYCYYRKQTQIRGECFIIKNHPKCPYWSTSTSKKIPILNKFHVLMDKIVSIKNI